MGDLTRLVVHINRLASRDDFQLKAVYAVLHQFSFDSNLIADQADELFWQVLAIFYPVTLMVELCDAQVQTELLTLARDLELLADLAV